MLERLLTPPNALCVEIMLRTGLRVSDVLKIRTEQLENSRLTISESKTGKQRIIRPPPKLMERMRQQAGSIYLFPNARDESRHRTRQAVWHDIKRAAKAMRIPLIIAPHSARKTYACDQYRKTGDIFAVQHLLNHDRLDTTIIYLLDEFKKKA